MKKVTDLKTEFGSILGYIDSSRSLYAAALLLAIIGGVTNGPIVARSIATLVDSISALDLALVSRSCVLLALAAVIMGFCVGFSDYFTAKVMENAALGMRKRVFSRAMGAKMEHWASHRVGDTVSVLTNDVETAKQSIKLLQRMVGDFSIIVSSVIMIAVWVPEVLATVAIMGSLSALIGGTLAKPVRQVSDEYQKGLEEQTATTTEMFGGLAVIKSLAAENTMLGRLSRVLDHQCRLGEKRGNLVGLQLGVAGLTQIFSLVGLSFVVGFMVLKGKIDLGQAVGVFQLAGAPFGRLSGLTASWTLLQQNLAGARRVEVASEIMQEEHKDHADAVVLGSDEILLEFSGIEFNYPQKEAILGGVSFRVGRGEKFAIQGPSGSGKTTILRLILRFLDPTNGTIVLKGRNIRQIPLSQLRHNVSYVAQEPFIFPGTIMENILMGNQKATESEAMAAAELANVHEFAEKLSRGYDTLLDERGGNLSGGQKQRICLARAFLKRADILLLDEPTSSVDATSAILIKESIDSYSKKAAVLMVSHDKSIIHGADMVLKIDDGKVTPVKQRNGLENVEPQQQESKSRATGG